MTTTVSNHRVTDEAPVQMHSTTFRQAERPNRVAGRIAHRSPNGAPEASPASGARRSGRQDAKGLLTALLHLVLIPGPDFPLFPKDFDREIK